MSNQTPLTSALPDATRRSDAVPAPSRQPVSAPAATFFRQFATALRLADAATLLTSLLLVYALGSSGLRVSSELALVMLLSPVVWIGTFQSFGLYAVGRLSAPEEVRRVVSATTLGLLFIVVATVWWDDVLDRQSLALTWVVLLSFELGFRWYARRQLEREKRLGRLVLRTLVIGSNQEALMIAETLSTAVTGFAPIGFVTSEGGHDRSLGLPVLGSIDDLVETIRSSSAECVVVASSEISSADASRVARACRLANAEIRLSVRAPDVLISRLNIEQGNNLTMVSIRPVKLTALQSTLKRAFDVAAASLALIVVMPLMVFVALAIKLTSKGPVVFRQERTTRGGRVFTMYKLRTMTAGDAEASDELLIDLTKPFFKIAHDPRLTWIGRLLRPLSLDELPQLWNVIKGDMSLVGPRPLPAEQVAANLDALEARHEVRAGLTGWWQINGRSEVDADEALHLDLFYIENWSMGLDIYILWKTVGVVLKRKGAY